ncbi:MAG: hypothetical protein R3D85_16475 [Paracoccaceae bacterium]|nr:hypothetical protein [Paracoccaceae bacterium]MCB2132372.1 hypothetical protein [Paracoccaceae bacterium]MCB2138075.1 hypothetical protein [Paracoccaceae bacterium]MCB2159959.1 hypothetical protein [Paracoccaceae bacterium]
MEDREAIEMMQRCSSEIRSQRRQIEALEPQAEAFRVISRIVGLIPGPSQGYGEDIAWQLDKRIKELRVQANAGDSKPTVEA